MRLHSLKIFLLLSFIWFGNLVAQYQIPKKPSVLYPVYDEVGLLSVQEKQQLNQKLIAFADSTSTEIMVIIIPTTKGEDINYVATMFGQQWEIGQKKVDNGVVFLIATEDKKVSIQQGRAVEQYLTASTAGQIIDYLVVPRFKRGAWYEGIDYGTTAIIEAVQGKFKPIPKPEGNSGLAAGIIIFIIIVFILLMFSGHDSNGRGGYDDEDVMITRRGRRSYSGGFFPFPGGGFGGGSSSGGGFGGFGGGGSFGGGGASGGW
ncbi:methanol dehydrogenase [Riemerella anatipestifer]|uniref:TPM domain-containing protein n=1 Tax=Riemerella anatipestifer TaxID=34085 RepID=UPI0007EC7D2D|nr:TPM domain-containing protein [Riemerella anatipestifer]MDY3501871.1 TPM domain-containing protein [Riemerella anatipestifer]OBP44405.1 methanol dehydrogenase [Riemerella anatipestifer]OBP48728.1 methanol dehydrogenase [Riemerella anatipestifer]